MCFLEWVSVGYLSLTAFLHLFAYVKKWFRCCYGADMMHMCIADFEYFILFEFFCFALNIYNDFNQFILLYF